jgi:hypothetical protein
VGIWNAEFRNRIQHRVEGREFRLQQGGASELHAAQGLTASIRNYGDVVTAKFFNHRDAQDTETIILFAHRETAMGKKPAQHNIIKPPPGRFNKNIQCSKSSYHL